MKGLIATLLLLIGFGGFVLWSVNQPVGGAGSVLFNIAKGDSVARIAQRLQDAQVVRRMLANMELKFTPAMRALSAAHHRTIFQELTMASVLEREVRSDADRAIVADIFWRRVDSGRGMEADSTVNYCTGKSLAS